jgi:hypothetical protein
MPKVEKRVARKDYPASKIVKGDTYYYTKLKAQRGGIVKRSKTPFKPSQLTNSPFKSGFLGAQEVWAEGDREADDMRSAAEAIRELGVECQSSFDNMPEGLQQGDTGQTLENRASECERIADDLDGFSDEWESLEDPGEEPVRDTPMEDDDPDDTSFDDELEDWQSRQSEYESEQERLQSEADSLLDDMPD